MMEQMETLQKSSNEVNVLYMNWLVILNITDIKEVTQKNDFVYLVVVAKNIDRARAIAQMAKSKIRGSFLVSVELIG